MKLLLVATYTSYMPSKYMPHAYRSNSSSANGDFCLHPSLSPLKICSLPPTQVLDSKQLALLWLKCLRNYGKIMHDHCLLWFLFPSNGVRARTYLQLPLGQWGAGNVYLLVLSSWKVNIAENPIAVMGL